MAKAHIALDTPPLFDVNIKWWDLLCSAWFLWNRKRWKYLILLYSSQPITVFLPPKNVKMYSHVTCNLSSTSTLSVYLLLKGYLMTSTKTFRMSVVKCLFSSFNLERQDRANSHCPRYKLLQKNLNKSLTECSNSFPTGKWKSLDISITKTWF